MPPLQGHGVRQRRWRGGRHASPGRCAAPTATTCMPSSRALPCNNDGSRKVGYLAPSVDGQAACHHRSPGGVGLSTPDTHELHRMRTAPATPVGDPIEIAALTQAFRQDTDADRVGYCKVGSVKTNIGHTRHCCWCGQPDQGHARARSTSEIPPSLQLRVRPIPRMRFRAAAPSTVASTSSSDWKTDPKGKPRRAGVNSLGVGGTNAFVVLEEAPAVRASPPHPSTSRTQLLVLSARKSQGSLDDNGSAALAAWLKDNAQD